MNLSQFFKDDKILITGASGFVGKNLFNKFKSEGLNVIGTYFSKKFDDLIYCDLTDFNQLKKLFDEQNIKYVFMCNAKTYGAGTMKVDPNCLVRENLHMNSNILDLAYQYKVKKLMFISSSTIYQEANYPLCEEDLDLNKPTYKLYHGVGGGKRYTEQLCQFYNSLGLNCNIIRPTGIYGPFDKHEEKKSHFMPAIIKRILQKQDPLIIWGNGHSVRNMIYIEDLIRDMLKVFMNYDKPDAFNVCSDTTCTIRGIVDIILKLDNNKIEPIYDITKPDAIPYRNISRIKFDSYFGKEQYLSLEEGIKKVIEWLKIELGV